MEIVLNHSLCSRYVLRKYFFAFEYGMNIVNHGVSVAMWSRQSLAKIALPQVPSQVTHISKQPVCVCASTFVEPGVWPKGLL